MRFYASYTLFLLLSLVMPSTWGQSSRLDFDQGVVAAQAGDYAEAFCIWKPLANLGHARAQYRLGWLYAKGLGLAVNETRAIDWWKLAAGLGHADAQFSLGWIYQHGEGVDRDIEKAVSYYLEASQNGQEDAKEILQEMLMLGNRQALQGLGRVLADNPSAMGRAAEISVKHANIRQGSDKANRILVTLSQGDELVVLGEKNGWLRVWLVESQQFGWIFKPLVSLKEIF